MPSVDARTHICFLSSEQLTDTRDGAPHPDGALIAAARPKIRHYRILYADRPDPIVIIGYCMIFYINTSRQLCDMGDMGKLVHVDKAPTICYFKANS